jgi:hypothetical protein
MSAFFWHPGNHQLLVAGYSLASKIGYWQNGARNDPRQSPMRHLRSVCNPRRFRKGERLRQFLWKCPAHMGPSISIKKRERSLEGYFGALLSQSYRRAPFEISLLLILKPYLWGGIT